MKEVQIKVRCKKSNWQKGQMLLLFLITKYENEVKNDVEYDWLIDGFFNDKECFWEDENGGNKRPNLTEEGDYIIWDTNHYFTFYKKNIEILEYVLADFEWLEYTIREII